jgi:tetratricopeptide (TPR) repeat protein
MEAAKAFERERYREADRQLKAIVDQAPDVPAVRELYGLNLYRLGRWREAAKQLEAFREQTGSVEQNPVLADSYRALNRHAKADKLWEELRTADAAGELVTEGRIVAAGSLADRGDIAGAIRLLEKGPVQVKRPKPHHVRLWYALADLYERAGDTPKARDLFGRVVANEPDFADAAERLAALD